MSHCRPLALAMVSTNNIVGNTAVEAGKPPPHSFKRSAGRAGPMRRSRPVHGIYVLTWNPCCFA
jgi:hypothetical protein